MKHAHHSYHLWFYSAISVHIWRSSFQRRIVGIIYFLFGDFYRPFQGFPCDFAVYTEFH